MTPDRWALARRDKPDAMTPATVQRVPNKPKTPMHSFRISDEDWEAAKAKAAERGENWSEELRKFARRYARSKR